MREDMPVVFALDLRLTGLGAFAGGELGGLVVTRRGQRERRDQIGAPLESEEAALYDRTEESLRTELGDVDFMAEWEQGKSLDLEDLVALVFGASS